MPDHTGVGGSRTAREGGDAQDAPGVERGVPRLGRGVRRGGPRRVHLAPALQPGEEDARR